MNEDAVLAALQNLYFQQGTQKALADLAGITQSTINAYLNGRAKIKNMPVGVFLRLFRDMEIDFFAKHLRRKNNDLLQNQIMEIFDSLDEREKVRMVAICAANFPDKIKTEMK